MIESDDENDEDGENDGGAGAAVLTTVTNLAGTVVAGGAGNSRFSFPSSWKK